MRHRNVHRPGRRLRKESRLPHDDDHHEHHHHEHHHHDDDQHDNVNHNDVDHHNDVDYHDDLNHDARHLHHDDARDHVDDDGNGLTDFEDPACCGTTLSTTITCSSLAPAGSATQLKLRGVLDVPPNVLAADIDDVFIQLRRPGGEELFCARIPAGDFLSVARGFDFRDPNRTVATAQGIDQIIVRSQQGHASTGAFGQRADFITPPPGPLVVTIGALSRPTSPQGGLCATTTAEFVPGRGDSLAFPDDAAAQACRRPSGPTRSTCRKAGTAGGLAFPVVGP